MPGLVPGIFCPVAGRFPIPGPNCFPLALKMR
jgi:hypothetical protein